MTDRSTLAEVVDVFDHLYDPATAEDWDAVGLVCGDPDAQVGKVLFAVDPVAAVVDEAIAWGADLVVTHHPMFLHAVHGVAATTERGRLVHALIANGVALHCAHTNADAADPGVNDALAKALGVTGLEPLASRPAGAFDKLVTFVPRDAAEQLIDAMASAGAGDIGDYDRCSWTTDGEGSFRPRIGANPTIGTVGVVEHVPEARVEMVLPRAARAKVVEALRRAHPYEEPAFDVVELAALPGTTGIGRVGRLDQALALREFVGRIADVLPATTVGVRAAGDPDRLVTTVAVCGGAGDSLLATARRAGVDAYVTSDLRHHPVVDHLADGGPAVVDVTHWASEWPWLADAAGRLEAALLERGTTVVTRVSTRSTDPWTLHQRSRSTR